MNEHTLDMRFDRTPPPSRHHHGRVRCGTNRFVNHSETAIVLRRLVYGLPEVGNAEDAQLVIYRRPTEDPSDRLTVPVRPGSIVVSPSTEELTTGHCFRDAFAMLVAIPGFVAPYELFEE